jgi:ABC-type multidrug transport system ATPase subunit
MSRAAGRPAAVHGLLPVATLPLTGRRRISIMPESPGLYRRLRVTENLEFFVRLHSLDARHRGGP